MIYKKFQNLKNNSGFIKYFKNTLWLFLEKLFKFLSIIVVGGFVARYLGPAHFGSLSFSISFVLIFTPISILGLDGIVVQYLVEKKFGINKILGSAFTLRLTGAIVMILLLLLIVFLWPQDGYVNLFIIIISVSSVFQSFNVIDFFFQSKVQSKYVVYSNLVLFSIGTLARVCFIIYKAPLIFFVYAVLLDSFVLASSLLYFYTRNGRKIFEWKFDYTIAKSLIKDSWPLLLSGIFVMLYMRIDQVMIKSIMGDEAVGKYAAAVRLGEACYFIPMVFSTSLFPSIISSKNIGEEIYYKRIQRLFNLLTKIAIAISVLITLFADWIIIKLYGPEYIESGKVLKLHIWACVFVFLGVASSKWFIVEGLQKISFFRTLVGLILNIIGNFLLIPEYGIIGAAFSTLISQIAASYLMDIFHNKTKRLFMMKSKSFLMIN